MRRPGAAASPLSSAQPASWAVTSARCDALAASCAPTAQASGAAPHHRRNSGSPAARIRTSVACERSDRCSTEPGAPASTPRSDTYSHAGADWTPGGGIDR